MDALLQRQEAPLDVLHGLWELQQAADTRFRHQHGAVGVVKGHQQGHGARQEDQEPMAN